ncbi:MAG TPA: carboxypeptidase-like regulatory domain-containing protein, partial [Pyrinomonadaceae bacterium]|nr:carboxypeptidase-like regulatory domain-containing protein [Pyrinomonadaceae bacterium]
MKNFAKIAVWALTIFAFLALGAAAFGQVQTGTLRGTITDPNGGVVAGATVTARNQTSGVTGASVQTNDQGNFSFTNLVPGKYTLSVEQSGFKKKSVVDVDVSLGAIVDLPVALEVGAMTEQVTVTSTGEELVNRDQAQISTHFETRKIEELPSNGAGGGLDTLALLAPGVVAQRNGGVNTDGAGLSVNGNRARSNNFQIDGSDN